MHFRVTHLSYQERARVVVEAVEANEEGVEALTMLEGS